MRLRLVFLTVFVIAACGLGYELVAGSLASYLLGDSITQFSTAIGLYLFALGIGAWLSRFVERHVVERFIDVELAVAFLGGTSALALFLAYGSGHWFRPILYGEVLAVGTLVGLEIPLLMRILKDELDFKELVSYVLTFDYVGALAVALAFPFLLVPDLGLIRSALLLGLLNAAVALWSTALFAGRLRRTFGLRARCVVVLGLLTAGLALAGEAETLSESALYADPVVHARTTPYQRIVVTQSRSGFQLFLNGALQFASADEYRYHEALVHPAFAVRPDARRVLILGGGDGLALREVLGHSSVESVTLVDLDPDMTHLSDRFPPLAALNHASFSDPKVHVVNADAMAWLQGEGEPYDVAIVDFPDPNSFALGKLYTTRFYTMLRSHLSPGAAVAVQCTSPLFARSSYWCIVRTIESAGFFVRPYQTAVPSFGVWGFALASTAPFERPSNAPAGLRFLNDATLAAMFDFGADMTPVDVEINRLDNQALVRYYESEWKRWE